VISAGRIKIAALTRIKRKSSTEDLVFGEENLNPSVLGSFFATTAMNLPHGVRFGRVRRITDSSRQKLRRQQNRVRFYGIRRSHRWTEIATSTFS